MSRVLPTQPETGRTSSEVREALERAARRRLEPLGDEYPFAPHYFQHPLDGPAAGAWQHYLDEGPRESRCVLFVHGNPTWSFAWRRAIRALSRRRRCVAPDHLGCGLSEKPEHFPYRLTQHVENLERLVLALDLRGITLVVHDWGGPIGLGFARRHPERIARLVITNTAAFPLQAVHAPTATPGDQRAGAPSPPAAAPPPAPGEPAGPERAAPDEHVLHPRAPTRPGVTHGSAPGHAARLPFRLAACRLPVFGQLAVRGLNAFARGATSMAVERPLAPRVKQGYLLPYDSWRNRVATHRFVTDIPLEPSHPSWDELSATARALAGFRDLPVQVLWGLCDWVFTPAFLEEWLRRFPAAVATRFPAAGHYLFEDESEAFLRELLGFVEP